MEINCLGCGFKVDLAGAYDDYVGQIKCFGCGAIMEIATQAGNIRAVNAVTEEQIPVVEEFVVRSVG
jgi:DNA-directed RNA polymerase subunit RPC12/RpoP